MEASGRKRDSARLHWDTKPRRAINPRDIEFQTAEIVIPNPARDQRTITSFGKLIDNIPFDKNQMNRLIWGDNLLAMQEVDGLALKLYTRYLPTANTQTGKCG